MLIPTRRDGPLQGGHLHCGRDAEGGKCEDLSDDVRDVSEAAQHAPPLPRRGAPAQGTEAH